MALRRTWILSLTALAVSAPWPAKTAKAPIPLWLPSAVLIPCLTAALREDGASDSEASSLHLYDYSQVVHIRDVAGEAGAVDAVASAGSTASSVRVARASGAHSADGAAFAASDYGGTGAAGAGAAVSVAAVGELQHSDGASADGRDGAKREGAKRQAGEIAHVGQQVDSADAESVDHNDHVRKRNHHDDTTSHKGHDEPDGSDGQDGQVVHTSPYGNDGQDEDGTSSPDGNAGQDFHVGHDSPNNPVGNGGADGNGSPKSSDGQDGNDSLRRNEGEDGHASPEGSVGQDGHRSLEGNESRANREEPDGREGNAGHFGHGRHGYGGQGLAGHGHGGHEPAGNVGHASHSYDSESHSGDAGRGYDGGHDSHGRAGHGHDGRGHGHGYDGHDDYGGHGSHDGHGQGHGHGYAPDVILPFSSPLPYARRKLHVDEERENFAEAQVGSLITMMLIVFVVYGLATLWATNSKDPQIKSYSYKVLSTIIVVYCALTLEQLQRETVFALLGKGTLAAELVRVALFCTWFWGLSIVCYLLSNRPCADPYAASGILLHVAAFTLIEMVGDIQEEVIEAVDHQTLASHPYRYGIIASCYAMTIVVIFAVIQGVSHLTQVWRFRRASSGDEVDDLAHNDATGEAGEMSLGSTSSEIPLARRLTQACSEDDDDWTRRAFDCESQTFSLAIGFFVKQLVFFLVSSRVTPMDCGPHPAQCIGTSREVLIMFGINGVLYIALFVVSALAVKFHTSWDSKGVEQLRAILSSSLCWLQMQTIINVLFLVLYSYSDDNSILRARSAKRITQAAASTPVLILVVIFLDRVADKGYVDSSVAEVFVEMLALLVGLLWERTFAGTISHFVTSLKGNHTSTDGTTCNMRGWFIEVSINFCLLAFIIPTWRWFIVPVACKPVPSRPLTEKEKDKAFKDKPHNTGPW